MYSPRGNYNLAAALLPSGLVLVVGGTEKPAPEELYDPVSDTWRRAGEMATWRDFPMATTLPSGQVLVAGGRTGWPTVSLPASAELFSLE